MATCAHAMPTTTARVNLVSNARARGVRARLGVVTGARIPSARHPAGVPGRRLGTLVVARSRDDGGSGGGDVAASVDVAGRSVTKATSFCAEQPARKTSVKQRMPKIDDE